jgi:hypothetical protein
LEATLPEEGALYLASLFLRFGVPLGLTIFLAWLLRNLDLHWLKDAVKDHPKERLNKGQVPDDCWVIHNVPNESDSAGKSKDPCWKIRMAFEGNLSDQCLECPYFKRGLLKSAA